MYWMIVVSCLVPSIGNMFKNKWLLLGAHGNDWIQQLKKPSWMPSDWVYSHTAAVHYTCMGYASFLIWRCNGFRVCGKAMLPLILYGTQLGLNWGWANPYFLRPHLGWGFIDLGLMTACVALCIAAFYRVSPFAGYLMLPYFFWLLVTMAINYRVYVDNTVKRRASRAKSRERRRQRENARVVE